MSAGQDGEVRKRRQSDARGVTGILLCRGLAEQCSKGLDTLNRGF